MIIKQLYKPIYKIPKINLFYRALTKTIILFFMIEKNLIFRNVFQQYLQTKISINVDGIKLFLKDGNERLLLFIKTMFILEKDVIQWINSFNNDDIFYDIGAREGIFSIYSAKKNVETFSFEPHFSNLETLQYNILLNDVANKITVVPNALGSKTGITIFSLRDLTAGSAKNEIQHEKSIYNNQNSSSALDLRLTNTSIEDSIKYNNLPIPTKVKIDVDGAEYLILLGFGSTLSKIDEIMIEMYEYTTDFEKCYKDYKYEYNLETEKMNKSYFIKDSNQTSKNPYFSEIDKLLKSYMFEKISEYGNNILYKSTKL